MPTPDDFTVDRSTGLPNLFSLIEEEVPRLFCGVFVKLFRFIEFRQQLVNRCRSSEPAPNQIVGPSAERHADVVGGGVAGV